jgi:hypothetical protein
VRLLRKVLSALAKDREGRGWAAMTYNYLRLGMVVAVFALAYSIIQEYREPGVNCALGSISGYWYTPVRPIFVGVMVAIGFALLVIKGRTAIEDMLLSLAGIMAPVVAFIPTDDPLTVKEPEFPPVCEMAMADAKHYQAAVEDGFVPASINNNLHTFLYAGYTAIAIVAIALVIRRCCSKRPSTADVTTEEPEVTHGEWINLVLGLALAITGTILLWTNYEFVEGSHGLAAGVMFGLLGLAAISNWVLGIRRSRTCENEEDRKIEKRYACTYGFVGGLMLFPGALFIVYQEIFDWSFLGPHAVLYIEALEIVLFVIFWVTQTAERWNQTAVMPRIAPRI